MGALDLAASEVLFEVEVEAYQPEDDGDGLCIGPGVLNRVCINDVLVDEFRVAQLERIKRQLVVEVLVGGSI
jgi:hypothetical protein